MYLDLLEIDLDFDMDTITNLKIKSMVFEENSARVIVPLDPSKETRYIEHAYDEYGDEYIDHIFKLIS